MALSKAARRLLTPAIAFNGYNCYRKGERVKRLKGIYRNMRVMPDLYVASPCKMAYLNRLLNTAGIDMLVKRNRWHRNRCQRRLNRIRLEMEVPEILPWVYFDYALEYAKILRSLLEAR